MGIGSWWWLCLFFSLTSETTSPSVAFRMEDSFEGEVMYGRILTITSEAEERIDGVAPEGWYVRGSVYNASGEIVRGGDIIVTKRAKMAELALNLARLRLRRAEQLCGNAKREYERHRELVRKNAVSESEFQDRETRYATSQLEMQEAANEVERCRTAISDCYIRAPFCGVVDQVFTTPGSTVADGGPVLRLCMTDPVRIRVQPHPSQWSQLANANRVLVFPSGSSTPVTAWPERIDGTTGTLWYFVSNPRTNRTIHDAQGNTYPAFDRVSYVMASGHEEMSEQTWIPPHISGSLPEIPEVSPASLRVALGAIKRDENGPFVWRRKEFRRTGRSDGSVYIRLEKVRVEPLDQISLCGNLVLMGLSDQTLLSPGDAIFADVPQGLSDLTWGVYQPRRLLFRIGEKVRVVFMNGDEQISL